MAALFSPLTVLAAVLLFLSTIASIMAGVGGMDETFLRDLPWLEGSAEVNVAEQLKLTNGYWMGRPWSCAGSVHKRLINV